MYNPSAVGKKGTIFGLPYGVGEADLVFIPVHQDVTTSFVDGTSKSPDIILQESTQIDLSLPQIEKPWELKMAMDDRLVPKGQNEIFRGRAKNVIAALEKGKIPDQEQVAFVNDWCSNICDLVESRSIQLLEEDKIPAVIGGDHASPLGLIKALAKTQSFGILQIDAHMDLRDTYEGFEYSHASIMNKALENPSISKLVQVGIRDFCEEEERVVQKAKGRIMVYYDEKIFQDKQEGSSWFQQCSDIIEHLPAFVYVSFDLDGLEPSLCPCTGTPVPGGLQFYEAVTLMERVVQSGRIIIGFDVCEAGPKPWDANVAARIIYRIATLAGVSKSLLEFR
ncbi:MAG: arginase family protein [Bacteroidota bacterium]